MTMQFVKAGKKSFNDNELADIDENERKIDVKSELWLRRYKTDIVCCDRIVRWMEDIDKVVMFSTMGAYDLYIVKNFENSRFKIKRCSFYARKVQRSFDCWYRIVVQKWFDFYSNCKSKTSA